MAKGSAGTVTVELDARSIKLQRELEKAARATKKNTRKMQASWAKSTNSIKSSVRGLGAVLGVAFAARSLKSVVDAGLAMQRIERALKVATGSAAAGKREFQFLADTSLQLGLDLESSALAFGRLSAAALGTELAGKGVRDIFLSVSQASTVLGLTSAQTSQGFVALEQIMSKGKLQAEEIRKQLGNVLPGAFRIAARAMGKTTAELDKMLSLGQIIAEDFLPKLSEELFRLFGDASVEAAESAQASINKLKTSIFLLKNAIAQSGVLDALAAFNVALSNLIRPATEKEKLVSDIAELTEKIAALQNKTEKQDVPFFETLKRQLSTIPRAIDITINPILDTAKILGLQLSTGIDLVVKADLSEVFVPAQTLAQQAIDELLPALDTAVAAKLKAQADELKSALETKEAADILKAAAAFQKLQSAADSFAKKFETAVDKTAVLRAELETFKNVLDPETGETIDLLPSADFDRISGIFDDKDNADLNKFLSRFETAEDKVIELRAMFAGFSGDILKAGGAEELERIGGLIDDIGKADLNAFLGQFETAEQGVALLRTEFEGFKDAIEEIDPKELERIGGLIDDLENADLTSFLSQFETTEQVMQRMLLELESFKEAIDDPEEFERISRLIAQMADDASVAWDQATRNMQDALAEFFMFSESGFKGLVNSMLDTIRKMLANSVAAKFFEFLKAGFGFGGGSSSGIVGAATKAGNKYGGSFIVPGFKYGGSFDVPAFARGGDFTVGGSGRADRQLVQFLATPGERVTITPAGKSGGNITVNLHQENNFEGGGLSDPASLIPILEENGRKIKAEMLDGLRRGGFA